MYCRKCGKPLKAAARFCANCGKEQAVPLNKRAIRGKDAFLQECKRYWYCFLVPVFYFLFYIILVLDFMEDFFGQNIGLLQFINQFSFWMFLGVFTYIVLRRGPYYVLLYTIPYFAREVCYIISLLIDNGSMAPSEWFVFIEGLCLPFILAGIVNLISLLLRKTKLRWLIGILVCIFNGLIVVLYWQATLFMSFILDSNMQFEEAIEWMKKTNINSISYSMGQAAFGVAALIYFICFLYRLIKERRISSWRKRRIQDKVIAMKTMATRYCGHCGEPLREEEDRCALCGAMVDGATAPAHAEREEQSVESALSRCADCGLLLQDGEKFCIRCGLRVLADNTKEDMSSEEESTGLQRELLTIFNANKVLAFILKYGFVLALLYPMYNLIARVPSLIDLYEFLSNFSIVLFFAYNLGLLAAYANKKFFALFTALLLRLINSLILVFKATTPWPSIFRILIIIIAGVFVYKKLMTQSQRRALRSIGGSTGKVCSHCGSIERTNDAFCPKCGCKM